MKKTLIYGGKPVAEYEETGDRDKDIENCRQILRELGLYKAPPTELEAMHTQAYSFATVALRIHDTLLQEERNIAGVTTFVVNAAFAIEVYLKGLTKCFGGTINRKEHGLKRLLDDLPADAVMAIKWQLPHCLGPRELKEQYDLAAILESINMAFIHWRYFYEEGSKAGPVEIPQVVYALQVLQMASSKSIFPRTL